MSTEFPSSDPPEWISQAEAARLHGVSRQAINKLVQSGRLRSVTIGGHVLVSRVDVEEFSPQRSGRHAADDNRDFERIRSILKSSNKITLNRVYAYLKEKRPSHPIEDRLGADADVILEAVSRAGELTTRMLRGVIAEAAFEVYVLNALKGWQSGAVVGNPAFDYLVSDGVGQVHVQVKLQRSERGTHITRSGFYVVETQRTRGGKRQGADGADEKTRPYRYGEFDILAVCLQPATARWQEFRYTVGNWLQPSRGDRASVATLQPVSPVANDDWSDDFLTCVSWFRDGSAKTIRGNLGRLEAPQQSEPP